MIKHIVKRIRIHLKGLPEYGELFQKVFIIIPLPVLDCKLIPKISVIL